MSFFRRIGGLFGGGRSGGGGGGGGVNIPSYNPGPNPAEAARPFLNQLAPIGREYYQPFIGQGQQASEITNPIYNRMTQDPTEFVNSLMRSYSPSEGYRFKERELTRAAQNSAAQGGFAGTRTSQLEQADLVRGLLGEDMQQYLSNILGVQGAGLQGQEGRIQRGYESSGNLADYLGNALGSQAGLEFQGQAQQNQNALDARNASMTQQNANMQNRTSRRSSLLNFLANAGATGAGIYTANPALIARGASGISGR